jgi:hypothetical protein
MTGNAVSRNVWNAFSSLALLLKAAGQKAGASSTHSKRFAPANGWTTPQYVTEITTPTT